MTRTDIDLFIEMITHMPSINEARIKEITEAMQKVRKETANNDEWITQSLYDIPKNNAEYLFVTFTLGNTGGMEVAMAQMNKN